MRYVRCHYRGRNRTGVLRNDAVALYPERFADLTAVIALHPVERRDLVTDESASVAEVRLLAPLTPPKNVMCIGRNYADHAAEIARARQTDEKLPEFPVVFTKAHTAICGPDDVVRLDPAISAQYDYEAELAVVVGRRCRDVAEADALDVVFGYTCMNDVTARDVQKAHQQWFKGKSLDGTCPLGPWIVDAGEIPDPQALRIEMRVNGERRQSASTGKMIFSVSRLIATLSRGMTLEPGDVIATGTPEGVGIGMDPPRFLADGDELEVEIERIGVLRNAIALGALAAI